SPTRRDRGVPVRAGQRRRARRVRAHGGAGRGRSLARPARARLAGRAERRVAPLGRPRGHGGGRHPRPRACAGTAAALARVMRRFALTLLILAACGGGGGNADDDASDDAPAVDAAGGTGPLTVTVYLQHGFPGATPGDGAWVAVQDGDGAWAAVTG